MLERAVARTQLFVIEKVDMLVLLLCFKLRCSHTGLFLRRVRYEQNVRWIRSADDIKGRNYTLMEELKCEDGVM